MTAEKEVGKQEILKSEAETKLKATGEFFTRNVNNKWQRVLVTAEEMEKIKSDVNKINLHVLLSLKEKFQPKYKLTDAEVLALFDKLSQHYRYAAESYVDENLVQDKLVVLK